MEPVTHTTTTVGTPLISEAVRPAEQAPVRPAEAPSPSGVSFAVGVRWAMIGAIAAGLVITILQWAQ